MKVSLHFIILLYIIMFSEIFLNYKLKNCTVVKFELNFNTLFLTIWVLNE